jgi:hypothetical protein
LIKRKSHELVKPIIIVIIVIIYRKNFYLRRNKEQYWAHEKPDNVSLSFVEETKQWHVFKDANFNKIAIND